MTVPAHVPKHVQAGNIVGMSTYWHEIMERYREHIPLPPTHPDGPRRMLTDNHIHIDMRTPAHNLTIAIPSLTTEQIRIYARQLRLMLKAHARQASRTPAWQRTHSKRRRAGMRRTRRMMRA